MIGLDTNVLIRLVVADDPTQAARAKQFVEHRCTPDSPCFINSVVLAEFVWVLTRVYQYRRSDIVAAIEGLLTGEDRIVEYHDEVRAGLEDYRSGRLDLIDALISQVNRAHGCEATATFDRKAARFDEFILVA